MRAPVFLLPVFGAVFLSACAPAPSVQSSRFEGAPLNFAAQPAQADPQIKALSELSQRIVVQTMIKGAGIGAAVGCGLAVVSAGNAQNCLASAAAGAVGGAVIGHVVGKRDVARRIEKVSPSAVVRTLRKTNAQMALVQTSLPARLEAQEQILAQLDLQRASGAIDASEYASGRAAIAAERRAMAAELIKTQGHAEQAAANLRVAQQQGQSGLEWHISATSKLAREASSARSNISLL